MKIIMWATNSYIVLSNTQPCSVVATNCKNLTPTNVNLCGRGQKREAERKARRKNRELPTLFPLRRLSHSFSNVDILTELNLILNVVMVEEKCGAGGWKTIEMWCWWC